MRVPFAHPAALSVPPPVWDSVRRVLVVRPDNLGDVVMTGPGLRALRAAAPRARITLLASPAGASAVPLLPEVDDVLVASPTWQIVGSQPVPDPARDLDLVARIAAGRYDVGVVLTSHGQSPWPAAAALHLAGVPARIGTSAEFGGALLTHWVPVPPEGRHQVDRVLDVLAAVGVPGCGADLRVRITDAETREGVRRLGVAGIAPGTPYAVILPGASCTARRWPPHGFAQVAAALATGGRSVVVAGSPRETHLVDEVVGDRVVRGRPVVPLAGVLDVPGLAAVLAGAEVAVVNNSGGMHLADAVRTPLVVLFAGTERPGEYAPRSSRAVVLNRRTACSPCRQFRCPLDHACLDVAADQVAAAARALARTAVAA